MSFITRLVQRRKMNELIAAWVEFRDVVTSLAGQGKATPEQEKRFLDLKASISSRLPILTLDGSTIGPGQEAQNQVRGMTELLNRYLTLGAGGPVPGDEGDDFLSRWHMHFLYLNQFKGRQREARAPRRTLAPPSIPPGSAGQGFRRVVGRIFDNWLVRFVVQVAILAAVVVIGARLLNIDLKRAPEWGRRVASEWWGKGSDTALQPGAPQPGESGGGPHGTAAGGAPTAQPGSAAASKTAGAGPAASGKGGATQDRTIRINDHTARPKYSVDGSGEFTPPAAPAKIRGGIDKLGSLIPRPVREFFSPVVERWGPEATVAMVGLALLLIGYLIFGRAR